MTRTTRAIAILTATSLAACQVAPSGPGPALTLYQGAAAQCSAGNRASCDYLTTIYPAVLAEQQESERNASNAANANATAAAVGGVAIGVLGLLAGAALAGGGRGYYAQPVYVMRGRRGW